MKIKVDYNSILLAFFLLSVEMLPNGNLILKGIKLIFVIGTVLYVLMKRKIGFNSYAGWLLLTCVLASVSFFWASSREYAISGIKTILLNALCIFCMLQMISSNVRWRKIVYLCLAVGPSLRFVYVFINYGLAIFGGLRNIGIDTGYNTVGMLAGAGTAFSLLGYLIEENNLKHKKWYVLFTINIFIVVLSMSRKAIVFLVLPLVFYYVVANKNPLKKLRSVVLVTLICVSGYIAIMNVPFLYNYVGRGIDTLLGFLQTSTGDTSAAGRMTRITWGMRWFNEHPFIGHGAMNYNYLFGGVESTTKMVVADNNFIELLVNYGVIGLIVYYGIYVSFFVRSFKNRRQFDKEKIAALGILISLLVSDYGSSSYIYMHSQMLLAVAIMVISYNNSKCQVKFLKF